MNEIAQLLQQKFGLSAEQSQQAETAVLGIIRSKVPSQFQGAFDSLLGGQASPTDSQTAAGESGGIGGLLGAAEGLLSGKF